MRVPKRTQRSDQPWIAHDDRELAPAIERGGREGEAPDERRTVVDQKKLAVRAQRPKRPASRNFHINPGIPALVKHAPDCRIGELGVEQANPLPRVVQEALDAGARIAIGPDDQPLALRVGEHWRLVRPVGGEDGGEARYHRGIASNQEKVAGAREAVCGEVERRDQRQAFVGDQVLRVVLVMHAGTADFDAVHVAPADEYGLFSREWGYTGYDLTSGMNQIGGTWTITQEGDEEVQWQSGLQQSDASGSAVAVIGTPVGNQQLHALMRVDSYAASTSGAWAGLLARYTDAQNHYYVTIRSSGQIQIRKIVNGVITVLASAPFVPTLGKYYAVDFRVINDQLSLYVDQMLVASAHDADIASGRYGIATYRATANWDSFVVIQP